MIAPLTLVCSKPSECPNSWVATHSKFVPLDCPSVYVSSSSKWARPSEGKYACARTLPGPSNVPPHVLSALVPPCLRVPKLKSGKVN